MLWLRHRVIKVHNCIIIQILGFRVKNERKQGTHVKSVELLVDRRCRVDLLLYCIESDSLVWRPFIVILLELSYWKWGRVGLVLVDKELYVSVRVDKVCCVQHLFDGFGTCFCFLGLWDKQKGLDRVFEHKKTFFVLILH